MPLKSPPFRPCRRRREIKISSWSRLRAALLLAHSGYPLWHTQGRRPGRWDPEPTAVRPCSRRGPPRRVYAPRAALVRSLGQITRTVELRALPRPRSSARGRGPIALDQAVGLIPAERRAASLSRYRLRPPGAASRPAVASSEGVHGGPTCARARARACAQ